VYTFTVQTALASAVVSSCNLELWHYDLDLRLHLVRVKLKTSMSNIYVVLKLLSKQNTYAQSRLTA